MDDKKPKKATYTEEKNNQPPVKVVEPTELPETRAIAPIKEFAMPLATVDEIRQASVRYQEFLNALLSEKDVVRIKDKKSGEEKLVGKKTAFGKIARFWGVSTEVLRSVVEEEVGKRDVWAKAANGGSYLKVKKGEVYLLAKAWVKAILPNGQFAVRGAAISESERNFAHLPHDLIATAETRAAKRAIEAVIGMGDIEMHEDGDREITPAKDEVVMSTPEQQKMIADLLIETSSNLNKFQDWLEEEYKVSSSAELTQKQAAEVLRKIRSKKYAKD